MNGTEATKATKVTKATQRANGAEASEDRVALSVVVVNWNAREHLERCLRALPEATAGRSFEAIVVDHASQDGSVDRLEQLAHGSMPWLRVVACADNPGFGAGVQRGFEASRGSWVAVLNPDTVPQPGCLAGLVSFLENHPAAGVAGPAHRAPDGEPLAGGADPLPGVLSAASDVPLVGRLYRRWRTRRQAQSLPTRCGSVRGACLLFRRRALTDIDGFPRDTFLYGEEILMGHRMAERGHEVWYVPGYAVTHDAGTSIGQRWSDAEVSVERRRVRIQVLEETLSPTGWLVWNTLSWLGLGLQAFLARIRLRQPQPSLSRLRRLHGRALLSGRPVSQGVLEKRNGAREA